MFRATKHLPALATLAVLGAASPLMAADSWFSIWFGNHDGHESRDRHESRPPVIIREPQRRPVVVIPPPVVVRPLEELPCDLSFTAYQSGETVIFVARGGNRAAGFLTSLSLCDTRGREPEVTLHNTAPAYCPQGGATRFEITGSFCVHGTVSCMTVVAAGQKFVVPVTQAARIG
jgi:hypothetical protein